MIVSSWWRIALIVSSMLSSIAFSHAAVVAMQDDAEISAAGLLIDSGGDEPVSVVVTYEGDDVPAIELLRLADVGAVTVEFGGLGEAVCEIVEVGCDVSTCRQRVCQTGDPESPFWQFWTPDEAGEWSLSPLGASHVTLQHQDVGAWVWTGTEPDLPEITWQELSADAGAPSSLQQGEAGEPDAVFASILPASTGGDESERDALVAAAVIAVVGVAGGALVFRQRRAMQRSDG